MPATMLPVSPLFTVCTWHFLPAAQGERDARERGRTAQHGSAQSCGGLLVTCCTALPPSACAHLPSDSVTVTLTCLHFRHSSIWLMGTGSCSRAEGSVDAQYWDWTELPWQQYTRQAQPPATPRLLPDRLPTLPSAKPS